MNSRLLLILTVLSFSASVITIENNSTGQQVAQTQSSTQNSPNLEEILDRQSRQLSKPMHPSALSQEDDQAGQALQQEIEEILAPGHWPYHELDQVLIHQPQVPYEELDELME